MHVLDLATPSSPRLLARLPTIGSWSDIAFAGARAFLVVESWNKADAPLQLVILDFQVPSEPKELSRTEIGSAHRREATGLTVLHGFAYVLTRDRLFYSASALEVFDVRDPVRPVRVGGNASFAGHSMATDGARVFVGSVHSLTLLSPYVPLQFDPPARSAGNPSLSLTGPPEWPVRVQRSTDLTIWQDWQSVTTRGDAPVELSDPEAASRPQRFYRAQAP
jgi:hypothetical protein